MFANAQVKLADRATLAHENPVVWLGRLALMLSMSLGTAASQAETQFSIGWLRAAALGVVAGTARVAFWGAVALAITAGEGSLFGASV